MKAVGVIPARWGATRFEGKVLALIDGRPMIQHVWTRASRCRTLNALCIACDDQRILQAANQFGAQAVLTAVDHASGTDRIAEAVADMQADIVVNIQGDEPLIEPAVIDALVTALVQAPQSVMATVATRIERRDEFEDPNVVKVVLNEARQALYFSRAPIPYPRAPQADGWGYKHIGLYAYRKDFLTRFTQLDVSRLEMIEKLEQLRVLEAGYPIEVVLTTHQSWGVDTPEDLRNVQRWMNQQKDE